MSIKDYQGPFLGFTFCGEHSSNFKIVRINSSNKGTMPLTPEFNDTTVERINSDGTFYFSTRNTELNFSVDFAFDDLTEVDLQGLRRFLSPKQYGELIFDETPYKKYIGKLKQAANLDYIAFDQDLLPSLSYQSRPELGADPTEEERRQWLREMKTLTNQLYGPNLKEHNERIYKGEGSLEFVCYYPYAVAPYQTIEEYEDKLLGNGYSNLNEWRAASRIMSQEEYRTYNLDISNNESTQLNNVGDIDSPLFFDFVLENGGGEDNYIEIRLDENNGLLIKTTLLENKKTYYFDSEKKLIKDEDGNLINYVIIAGDFFNVPVGIHTLSLSTSVPCAISNIRYEYRYL